MINYTDDIKQMNLYEKIANIAGEINYLKKDDNVGMGKNSYKAISNEKVISVVSKKMADYGVVVYPIKQEYTRTDETVTGIDYKTQKEVEKINRISDVNVVYRFINIHNKDEFFDTVASGTGVDTQDKGIGKAQTYAFKNMLLKVFLIPTGEDTDKIHSDDYTAKLKGYNQNAELENNAPVLTAVQSKTLIEAGKTKEVTQVKEVLKKYGYKSSKEILITDFTNILNEVKALEDKQ